MCLGLSLSSSTVHQEKDFLTTSHISFQFCMSNKVGKVSMKPREVMIIV